MQVFVYYVQADAGLAQALASALQARGLSVPISEPADAGQTRRIHKAAPPLRKAVLRAQAFCLLLSDRPEHSGALSECGFEILSVTGESPDRPLIPVVLPGVSVPAFLASWTAVPLADTSAASIDAAADSIANALLHGANHRVERSWKTGSEVPDRLKSIRSWATQLREPKSGEGNE